MQRVRTTPPLYPSQQELAAFLPFNGDLRFLDSLMAQMGNMVRDKETVAQMYVTAGLVDMPAMLNHVVEQAGAEARSSERGFGLGEVPFVLQTDVGEVRGAIKAFVRIQRHKTKTTLRIETAEGSVPFVTGWRILVFTYKQIRTRRGEYSKWKVGGATDHEHMRIVLSRALGFLLTDDNWAQARVHFAYNQLVIKSDADDVGTDTKLVDQYTDNAVIRKMYQYPDMPVPMIKLSFYDRAHDLHSIFFPRRGQDGSIADFVLVKQHHEDDINNEMGWNERTFRWPGVPIIGYADEMGTAFETETIVTSSVHVNLGGDEGMFTGRRKVRETYMEDGSGVQRVENYAVSVPWNGEHEWMAVNDPATGCYMRRLVTAPGRPPTVTFAAYFFEAPSLQTMFPNLDFAALPAMLQSVGIQPMPKTIHMLQYLADKPVVFMNSYGIGANGVLEQENEINLSMLTTVMPAARVHARHAIFDIWGQDPMAISEPDVDLGSTDTLIDWVTANQPTPFLDSPHIVPLPPSALSGGAVGQVGTRHEMERPQQTMRREMPRMRRGEYEADVEMFEMPQFPGLPGMEE